MIISKELAQNIVHNLMGIVERNVNIMDCSGIIVASGQPNRINTFHQGGKIAATEHHVVEIYPEEVHSYSGALPGVMWPINLKGKIVGVVGVTGEPHEVRNTANLVKTVTELVLEREMFLADYRSENRMKEQLVTLLFSDNLNVVMDDVVRLAEMLNYRLNLPRLVVVIKMEPKISESFAANGLYNLFSDRIRENVSNALKDAAFFTPDDMSLFYKRKLCILKALSNNMDVKKIRSFASNLVKMLNTIQSDLKIKVGIGSRVLNESQLRHSYCEAAFALEYTNSNVISLISDFDILLKFLFDRQCPTYDSCLALLELKQKFDETKAKYDIVKTLNCLLDNNLNVSSTADQLFIHRNTLKFRLEKLKKTVGLEPSRFFHHAMLCKFLLTIDKTG